MVDTMRSAVVAKRPMKNDEGKGSPSSSFPWEEHKVLPGRVSRGVVVERQARQGPDLSIHAPLLVFVRLDPPSLMYHY
jgi:hypothetical protein